MRVLLFSFGSLVNSHSTVRVQWPHLLCLCRMTLNLQQPEPVLFSPEPLTLCWLPSVSAKPAHYWHCFHFPHLFGGKLAVPRQVCPPDEDNLEQVVLPNGLVSLRITPCLHDFEFLVTFVPQGSCYNCFLGLKKLGVYVQCIAPKRVSVVLERILCKCDIFCSPLGHWWTLLYDLIYCPFAGRHLIYSIQNLYYLASPCVSHFQYLLTLPIWGTAFIFLISLGENLLYQGNLYVTQWLVSDLIQVMPLRLIVFL